MIYKLGARRDFCETQSLRICCVVLRSEAAVVVPGGRSPFPHLRFFDCIQRVRIDSGWSSNQRSTTFAAVDGPLLSVSLPSSITIRSLVSSDYEINYM